MSILTPDIDAEDPALSQKAARLLACPYFAVGDDVPLSEKQLIFYVLAGIKPLSEVSSCHMEWLSPTYAESRGDDQAGVAAFLDSLGLRYAFRRPYDGNVTVSLQAELLRSLDAVDLGADEATIYRRYGQLYGYPDTAVEAAVAEWVHDRPSLLSMKEQERVEDESGLPRDAFLFRLSTAHWQDEVETVRSWYAVLRAYGMTRPHTHRHPASPA